MWVLFFGSQLWNINQPSWLHPGLFFFFLVTPVASSAPLPNSTFPLLLPSSASPLPCLVFLETIGIGLPCVVEEEHPPSQKSRFPLPCDSSLCIKSPLTVCLGASLEVQGLRHHTSTAGDSSSISGQGTKTPYSTEQLSHNYWAVCSGAQAPQLLSQRATTRELLLPSKDLAWCNEGLACCKLFLWPDASNK